MAVGCEAQDGSWIAVQVRPGIERTVSRSLQLRGYVDFLPSYPISHSKKSHEAGTVLFPGYVFCQYLRHPCFRIVEIPGVVRLVGFGNKVVAIPDEEIESIRHVVESNARSKPVPFFQTGQRVLVVNGPLSGVKGVLLRQERGPWVVVSIPLLNRAVAVEVRIDDVRPLLSDPPNTVVLDEKSSNAWTNCDWM